MDGFLRKFVCLRILCQNIFTYFYSFIYVSEEIKARSTEYLNNSGTDFDKILNADKYLGYGIVSGW